LTLLGFAKQGAHQFVFPRVHLATTPFPFFRWSLSVDIPELSVQRDELRTPFHFIFLLCGQSLPKVGIVGHSDAAKEVSHKSAELSAEVSVLTVGAGIVRLIIFAMGAWVEVATLFHSLRRGIKLIYVVGLEQKQEVKGSAAATTG
jgi:hypothetical protein